MDTLKNTSIFAATSAQNCLCQQAEKQTRDPPMSKGNLEALFKNKP